MRLGRGIGRSALICCLLIICAAAQAAPAEEAAAQKVRCPVCGMFVAMFADWNARIEFDDSTHAVFDGAKDMFKYYLDIKKYNPSKSRNNVTAIFVKDYYSKESVDAGKAFYVIWSDTYGPMGHEPIPFEKEADAEKFMLEHKGKRIIRFKAVTAKLLHSLDNP